MSVYVKNGTPVGSQSQCAKCEHAHIMRGFRESEELTYCNSPTDLVLVPFKVRECSNYSDKTRPTWDQMQDLAIEIRATPTLKPAGFFADQEPESEVAPEIPATR
ncbi:MAG TPA: hypothetical protein VFC15_14805 [Candidatus Limnocylindrales bacterium]|nr:hypothetical protein [Candidatus Limnocylindrales bacterium]